MSKLNFDQMLTELDIISLKDRRLIRGLIQIFKIMKGLDVVILGKDLNNKARRRYHKLSYNSDLKAREETILHF